MSIADFQGTVTAVEARRFATSPTAYFEHSWYAMHHLDPERLTALQLAALRIRFEQMPDRIPTLAAMVREQGTSTIERLEDVVPLLFQHLVYKSYPASVLERNRFGELTRWLGRLTTHNLGGLDVAGCDSIDAWLDVLDSETDLRVLHSSGTTGTMSFLPRTKAEWDEMFAGVRCGQFQFSDPHSERDHTGEYFNLIWPLYRYGRSAITRVPELALEQLLGSEERLHVMRQGRISSDSVYLTGRVRAAAARGELDRLEINPALRRRREQFEREQRELREGLPRFIEHTISELRGQRVWVLATWNVLYEMARVGLERGVSDAFAPDSLITTGGGAKGQVVPDDWEEQVKLFTGVERLQHVYAMSELTAFNKLCEHGHYHIEPWIVPFILDPDDGRPLPREGLQTGRAAFFDLVPSSYWGGFITGDEVTAEWGPCACGRTTPHILRKIERYSEKQGGDDKITCAASDDAHRAALDFLSAQLA
ncbi:MAG: hypothetical protein ACYDHH_21930 [Solirubrobacteraceae bacterium]